MAQEGLFLHLGAMIEDNAPLSPPSTIKEALVTHMAKREQGNAPLEECVCQFVPYIPSPKRKKLSVCLSISLKPVVLKRIDQASSELGLTRSGLIVVVTKHWYPF